MKVTRRKITASMVKPKTYRPARRYVNPADQIQYTELLDKTVNNPQTFTYLDYERNKNMINVLRKQYEDIIRMYRS